jgi:hypothetical protein
MQFGEAALELDAEVDAEVELELEAPCEVVGCAIWLVQRASDPSEGSNGAAR